MTLQGGVKWTPNVPKDFFQAFYDISAQEKKNADENLKKSKRNFRNTLNDRTYPDISFHCETSRNDKT